MGPKTILLYKALGYFDILIPRESYKRPRLLGCSRLGPYHPPPPRPESATTGFQRFGGLGGVGFRVFAKVL